MFLGVSSPSGGNLVTSWTFHFSQLGRFSILVDCLCLQTLKSIPTKNCIAVPIASFMTKYPQLVLIHSIHPIFHRQPFLIKVFSQARRTDWLLFPLWIYLYVWRFECHYGSLTLVLQLSTIDFVPNELYKTIIKWMPHHTLMYNNSYTSFWYSNSNCVCHISSICWEQKLSTTTDTCWLGISLKGKNIRVHVLFWNKGVLTNPKFFDCTPKY